jgi:hypothetical protein
VSDAGTCARKSRYKNKKTATNAAKVRHWKFARPYKCDICQRWHLTNNVFSRVWRILDGLKTPKVQTTGLRPTTKE